ncbi:MAG: EF-P 5-aminopentanol modification-associated protein YfmF [Halanaerobium sp.]
MNNDLEFKNINKRFNIHYLSTDKFKTNLIQLYFMLPLKNNKEAAMTALLPAVLKRGSENFPNSRAVKTELEELYGSKLNFNVVKRGENQILKFSLEIVNEKFLPHKENLTEKAFGLLNDIIFNPLLEKGRFKQNFLTQEKENLKNNIISLINDKYSYALEKCIKNMCRDEKYGIYKLGDIRAVDAVSSEELYNHYKKTIDAARRSLFLVGSFKKSFRDNIYQNTPLKAGKEIYDKNTELIYRDKEVDYYQEKLSVNQAKLTLGFRTGITRKMDDYYALLVCSSLLGGSTHSKLFQEIREKRSLAYYVNSSIESTKGLLFVNSGIDADNSEKVVELINREIKEIIEGNFSENDFLRSKKSIINSLKEDYDSSRALAAQYLLSLINERRESISDTIEGINSVGISDVQAAAAKFKLDTVYLLKSEE